MQAARQIASDPGVTFLFVGGGSEMAEVQREADHLPNVKCLPYQPLKTLSGSLSAADLHVVVMGDPFVGIIHPCKIYNILQVGAPVLYIGPEVSHVSEILERWVDPDRWIGARHGDVDAVTKAIRVGSAQMRNGGLDVRGEKRGDRKWETEGATRFSKEALLPQLVALISDSHRR
jgi:colanic acid biosynthesis glycosyl transferase WcaI